MMMFLYAAYSKLVPVTYVATYWYNSYKYSLEVLVRVNNCVNGTGIDPSGYLGFEAKACLITTHALLVLYLYGTGTSTVYRKIAYATVHKYPPKPFLRICTYCK